ncbi:MAG TPA: hypothetical protein VJN96_14140 [Vicinamibacterales bacterium]|nr:hypothetical protein [Vicinamibacterales bacterium]
MAERSKVVSFERFRKARERARLPLFDDTLSALEPPRSLTEREVAHRERMLNHLREGRDQALGIGH